MDHSNRPVVLNDRIIGLLSHYVNNLIATQLNPSMVDINITNFMNHYFEQDFIETIITIPTTCGSPLILNPDSQLIHEEVEDPLKTITLMHLAYNLNQKFNP